MEMSGKRREAEGRRRGGGIAFSLFNFWLWAFVSPERRSIVMSACVCLCVRACASDLHQFVMCYQWPWLGPPLAALRYVMYFRFYGRRHDWT